MSRVGIPSGAGAWSAEGEVRPEVRHGLRCQGEDPGHYPQALGAMGMGAWEG